MVFINLPITITTTLLLATLAFTSPTPDSPPEVLRVKIKYMGFKDVEGHWNPLMKISPDKNSEAAKLDEPAEASAAVIVEVPDGYDIRDVHCQAYTDDAGRTPVGKRLTGHKGAQFVPVGQKPVVIRSFRCFHSITPCKDKAKNEKLRCLLDLWKKKNKSGR